MANQTAPAPDYCGLIVNGTSAFALVFADPDGVVRSWNPGAEALFGHAAQAALGTHVSSLFPPGEQISLPGDADRGHMLRPLLRSNGQTLWGEVTLSRAQDDTGAAIGYILAARSAAEQKRLEQALTRSTDELNRFAFTVSHDLNEPLRGVRSYAELLERRYGPKLDADAGEFIAYITGGARRMGQLLNDILAWSQAGREDKTRPEATNSNNVFQWALMNVDKLTKETGAVITYGPLPTVHADQTQLASVFQHLLTNAMKFHGAEAPRIHVTAARTPQDMWQFSVEDNGTGIEPDQLERVFGIFKRLVGRDVPGTGIGLAICRKIVEAHGGRMWIESQPGKGSTVRFTLAPA